MRFAIPLLMFLVIPVFANDKAPKNQQPQQDQSKPVARIITEPRLRLTKNWIFVVDNSDSMLDVFHKSLEGFKLVTQMPTDDWQFKLIVFSDLGKQRIFKSPNDEGKQEEWQTASPESFDKARRWANNPQQRGTQSHGLPALVAALQEPIQDLTIILISDGGLTSACENRGFAETESIIAKWQAWRSKNNYGMAIITTIGISNKHYSAFCPACNRNKAGAKHNYSIPDQWQTNKGHKPTDIDCQAFMQRLGSTYFGGYILVENW